MTEDNGFDFAFLWQAPLYILAIWLIGMLCVWGMQAPPTVTGPFGP